MGRKKRTTQQKEVQDYRHDTATRKNNPPAGIAAQGKINETPEAGIRLQSAPATQPPIRPKRRRRQTARTAPKSKNNTTKKSELSRGFYFWTHGRFVRMDCNLEHLNNSCVNADGRKRRQRESHRAWYSPSGYRLIVQPNRSMAKGYQVRQFLKQYNKVNLVILTRKPLKIA